MLHWKCSGWNLAETKFQIIIKHLYYKQSPSTEKTLLKILGHEKCLELYPGFINKLKLIKNDKKNETNLT